MHKVRQWHPSVPTLPRTPDRAAESAQTDRMPGVGKLREFPAGAAASGQPPLGLTDVRLVPVM